MEIEKQLLDCIKKLKFSIFIEKTKKAGIYTDKLKEWYKSYLEFLFNINPSEFNDSNTKEKIENVYISKEIEYLMDYIRSWDKYEASVYDYYIDYLEGIEE